MIPAVCPLPGIQQYLSLYLSYWYTQPLSKTAYELDVIFAKSPLTLVNCDASLATPTQELLRGDATTNKSFLNSASCIALLTRLLWSASVS